MRRALFIFALLLLATMRAAAVGTFIPAAGRADVVHDFVRDRVYISNGASVLVYDIGTNAFLPPFQLGGSLVGMDISIDGNTLAVADATRTDTQVWIDLVDLRDGTSRKLFAPRDFMEGGTYTVVFGYDGSVTSTSTFEGSGWAPMRRWTPSTGAVATVFSPRQDTMLAPSGDRRRIAFAQANISDGEWGRYSLDTNSIVSRTGYTDGTSWFNYEIATNRDGTRFVIPTYGGTFFYDNTYTKVATIGTYATSLPIGVAWHPVENLVYLPWWPTSEVRVYDAGTFTQVGAFDFEAPFPWIGNWAFGSGRTRLSVDGSLLMVTVNGGVRILRMYAPLDAADFRVSTVYNTPVGFDLQGSIGNGGTLSYSLVGKPAHGTATLTGKRVTYTPALGYRGNDTVGYRVTYGQAAVDAVATISVASRPPVASNLTFSLNEDTQVSFRLSATDPDRDPVTYAIVAMPAHGTLTGTPPAMTYKPAPNYFGTDTFTYRASDGTSFSNVATVTLKVANVNDPPVARPDSATAFLLKPVTIAVLANDSDPDGDALRVVSVSRPTTGSARMLGNNIVYTGVQRGTATFNYTIADPKGLTSTATVTVTVQ